MNWLKWHLYLAAVCGLQMLLWLGSGLTLSLIDEDYLDSNRHRVKEMHEPSGEVLHFNPERLALPAAITDIRLDSLLSRPVYRLQFGEQSMSLWADTLETLALDDTKLREIAAASINVALTPKLQYLSGDTIGFPGSAKVALFEAQTDRNTRVLVDAESGKLLAHKDIGSDLKELLLMLHFMDYAPGNGIAFNHLGIRLFAILTLLMVLTGSMVVWQRWQAGFYRFRKAGAKNNPQHLSVLDTQGNVLGQFCAGPSLLETINADSPLLPTQCGGGGSCGLCTLVFIDTPPTATEADIKRLGKRVDQGHRLACQHGAYSGRVRLANKAQERYWHKQCQTTEPVGGENV
ncbi:PepSY domain-containing protein [Shewanella litorisediminis]|uniref:PepSY domain-containing protein n=1 Tax=Shewanella litorisediminis TaxID=1173586 RepID=A0ABX7G4G2_9GAMM|nr:PepSY domain-containing protein [Shewanella litorisediminis]MCL2919983.1 PepSY domain-containing protein [Shewanella litorisediminis]QRH02157.1 PepSY domain-containing protein [Shewanella litorisediminis]